jgi:nucleoside-diphosphate-sugar epimerase
MARAAGLANWTLYLAPPPNTGAADPRLGHWLTAHGAAQAKRAGTSKPSPRLVYMSTTGVYGDRAGGWVSETTPVQPTTPRAKRRVDAEQQIRQAIKRRRPGGRLGRRLERPPSLQANILRVPGIYAAERLPEERLRNRLPVADGTGDGYTNHIHADDLARLTVLGLIRMRSGRVFNTVDQSDLRTGQWLDMVADTLGLPPPPRVPKAEMAQYLTPMMLSFLSESRRIDGRRALRELRARLRWPTVEDFLKSYSVRRI